MLNISRQIQVGWGKVFTTVLPEAEVIPVGNAANEKKKLEKFTAQHAINKECENIPLPGFTLFKTSRKNWGSIDPTWLIIDPRGFLVRITNDNLESILHVTGITEGLIQEKCVWARNDTQTKMTLVPVSSPLYIDAMRNTELIEGKVDFKEVEIGDEVLLQNELTGVYMGVVSLYGPITNYSVTKDFKPQVYLRRKVIEVNPGTYPGTYHYQTDLKILKILKKGPSLTREETAKSMNNSIASGAAYFTNSTYINRTSTSIRDTISHVSVHAKPSVGISYVEIDKVNATRLFHDAQALNDFGVLMLEDADERKYLIDFPYFMGVAAMSINAFEIVEIDKLYNDMIVLKKSRDYGGRGKETFSLDKFTKFYKIVKHVKDETYV